MADKTSICPRHDVKEPCWCCEQDKSKQEAPQQKGQEKKEEKTFSNPGR